MLFSWSAALLNVVMDSGTFCWLSERFSAVTVISSSSPEAATVSAAWTPKGAIAATAQAKAEQFLNIPIIFLPKKIDGAVYAERTRPSDTNRQIPIARILPGGGRPAQRSCG